MKWTAATLLLFLASNVQAQRMNPSPHQGIDSGGNSTAPWIDMVPDRPAAAAHATEPLKAVSVQELLIPSKALKEIQRSQKAFESGDLRASNQHLEKALHLYPDIPQARFDLGGNYLRLHEYEKALAEFRQYVESNPERSQGHYALSVAYFLLHLYPQAEDSGRRALELDPDLVEYRYMVGNAMVAQGHCTPEAKELLRQSRDKFPNASLVLAQMFLNEGKVDDVVTELRAYLRSPDPSNKANAECWVALLNGTASGACAAGKTFPIFR